MRRITLLISMAVVLLSCVSKESAGLLAIESLKVEQLNTSAIRLTWVNNNPSYEGVVIERAIDDAEFSELKRVAGGTQIYQDRGLTQDGVYKYRLAAYSGSEMGPYVEGTCEFYRLPAPTDAAYEVLSGGGIKITWKDNCSGEEGYLVRRSKRGGEMTNWKTLEPNTVMVTDPEAETGVYVYEIYAFGSDARSNAAVVTYSNIVDPVLTVNKVESSYYMVHVDMTLTDDGGNVCSAGICWKKDGSAGATVDDECFTYPRTQLKSGDRCFGSAIRLEDKEYSFRPWVKYEGKIKYLEERTARLQAQPSAITLNWTPLTSYSMPSSIELKTATFTSTKGTSVQAWVAIADMDKSGAELELRTVYANTTKKTSAAVKDGSLGSNVYVAVNGGFFASTQSYSYVLDRGELLPNAAKSAGVKAVTRSYYDESGKSVSASFSVTRGAFGVDQNQQPSVKWLYADKAWAYDTPLPAFNSGPNMSPDANFPDTRHTWNVYSAIGGGPVILYNGRMAFDHLVTKDKGNGGRYIGNPELLDDDIFGPNTVPPRTAIGHTADGKIVIIAIAAPSSATSSLRRGVTLEELARIMKGLGCVNVLNLDGGGSTTFCVTSNGTILNKPSDGTERAVGSFVALVKKN